MSKGSRREREAVDTVDAPTFSDVWKCLRKDHGVIMSTLMYPGMVVTVIAVVSGEKDRRSRERRVKQEERWREEVRNE